MSLRTLNEIQILMTKHSKWHDKPNEWGLERMSAILNNLVFPKCFH